MALRPTPSRLTLAPARRSWVSSPFLDYHKTKKVSIKLTFDNSENKEAYLSGIKSAYLMGLLDGVTYGILKNAADGGFSGSISDLSGSSLFGAASVFAASLAVSLYFVASLGANALSMSPLFVRQ